MQDGFDDAPDEEVGFSADDNRFEVGVFRAQFDAIFAAEEAFDGEFSVDGGDDDVAVGGIEASIDDKDVAGEDPRVAHRLSGRANKEGRSGVRNEVFA